MSLTATEDSADLAQLALDVHELANEAVLNIYRNDLDGVAKMLDAIRDRLSTKEPQA